MSEAEKQESQKTVVAFITGLLVGGLLVWIFSGSPEQAVAPEVESETQEETLVEENTGATDEEVAPAAPVRVVAGEGSVLVDDQPAGTRVVLGALELPTTSGWVVVREFAGGVAGNILGAARYNVEQGIVPAAVELIRATVAGGEYQVVFFTNEGGASFDLGEDVQIDGIATTFSAE